MTSPRQNASRPLRPRRRKPPGGRGDGRQKPAQGRGYNVEALTDRTGAIVERYEYTPYGEPTVYTGKGADGKWYTSDDVTAGKSARGNDVLFQGRSIDWESGLYYYRARMYSPGMGRFISRDPMRYSAGDINFSRAFSNAPNLFRDPKGLVTQKFSWSKTFRSREYMANNGMVRGGIDHRTHQVKCVCKSSCDQTKNPITSLWSKVWKMECDVETVVEVNILDASAPEWKWKDDKYPAFGSTVNEQMEAVLQHELDHLSDYGRFHRFVLSKLFAEEERAYAGKSGESDCKDRARLIEKHSQGLFDGLFTQTKRFDKLKDEGVYQDRDGLRDDVVPLTWEWLP